MLGLTTGSGKSTVFQVAVMLLGGVTLVIVPLLALGADQLQKIKSVGCISVNLDEISKSKEATDELKQKLDSYKSTRDIFSTVYLFALPQTLNIWRPTLHGLV